MLHQDTLTSLTLVSISAKITAIFFATGKTAHTSAYFPVKGPWCATLTHSMSLRVQSIVLSVTSFSVGKITWPNIWDGFTGSEFDKGAVDLEVLGVRVWVKPNRRLAFAETYMCFFGTVTIWRRMRINGRLGKMSLKLGSMKYYIAGDCMDWESIRDLRSRFYNGRLKCVYIHCTLFCFGPTLAPFSVFVPLFFRPCHLPLRISATYEILDSLHTNPSFKASIPFHTLFSPNFGLSFFHPFLAHSWAPQVIVVQKQWLMANIHFLWMATSHSLPEHTSRWAYHRSRRLRAKQTTEQPNRLYSKAETTQDQYENRHWRQRACMYGIVMKSLKHVHDEEDTANQLFGAVPTTFNESRTVFGMIRGSVFSTT
jgi:hypothetical protein